MTMQTPSNEVTLLKQQLSVMQNENQHLQYQIAQQEQTITQLTRWLTGLQHSINGIQHSFTWRIGEKITHFILALMRRKAGPTAFNQINSFSTSFRYWLNHFRQDNKVQKRTLYTQSWYVSTEYQAWFKRYFELEQSEQLKLLEQVNALENLPDIAIIIHVDMHLTGLSNTLQSIVNQLYGAWRIILLAPVSTKAIIQPFLTENTHCLFVDEIQKSFKLNDLLLELKEPYFIFLNGGDRLPNYALCKIVQAIKHAPEALFWYSDHDHIDNDGNCSTPYFKPDWSPDLFYSNDYIQEAIIFDSYKLKNLKNIESLPQENLSSLIYGLILYFLNTKNDNKPFHIKFILFNKATTTKISQAVAETLLKDYFEKKNKNVNIFALKSNFQPAFRTCYLLPNVLPLVSIIIPIKDKVNLLENLLEGLLKKTNYNNIEIIVIDNQSKELETFNYLNKITKENVFVKCLNYPKPFNYSAINNWGVQQAKGEVIAFLNNDLEVINADWLAELVAHALRPEVGAVGAKLYYANDTVQHAGVHTSYEGIGWHTLKHFSREDAGYYGKLQLIQNYSAVTAACLVMRKTVFQQVQGFDETLKVAFNDVDLCLKLRQLGYYIVWTPFAELYHLESVSRGDDTSMKQHLRLRQELVTMQTRWQFELANDPFYHPHLDTTTETYQLAYPPRNGLV